MADEDGDNIDDTEIEMTDDEEGVDAQTTRPKKPKYTCKCNTRIDELAQPGKRIFLALWNEHAHHFQKDRAQHLKKLLQELYAMSPEETAKYFAELRSEAKAMAFKKRLRQKLRKFLKDKKRKVLKEKAYRFFKNILKSGIQYAATHETPPLISIRLRFLSDAILEQLCELRELRTPSRENPTLQPIDTFMISIADWIAIAIERLYFEVQTKDRNGDTNAPATPPCESKFALPKPVATSTPKRTGV